MSFLPARNVAEELAPLLQGITQAGQGIGQGIQRRREEEQKQQQNIQSLRLGQKLGLIPEDLDLEQFEGADPTQIASLEKAQQKSQPKGQASLTEEEEGDLVQEMIANGWPEREARLFLRSSPGVQQTMQRRHDRLLDRGFRKPVEDMNQQEIKEANEEDEAPFQETRRGFHWKEIPPPENANEKEIQDFRKLNQRENNKELKERKKSLDTKQKENVRFDILSDLNDSDKLPAGMGTVVLDRDGNVRPEAQLLGLVNKETQRFVKTLNDFTSAAKDSFGARVTNFDLEVFLKRLPGLLNSPEGRRAVIEQMKLINQLDAVKDEAMVDALEFHGNRANFADISKQVSDEILDREEAIIGKINRLDEATKQLDIMANNPEKFEGMTLMYHPDVGFRAIRKTQVDEARDKWGFDKW